MSTLLQQLPPGALLMIGGLLILLLPKKQQGWGAVVLALLSFAHLLIAFPAPSLTELPEESLKAFGEGWVSCGSGCVGMTSELLGQDIMPIRVDRLALIFGYVFHIAAVLSTIYALRVEDPIQHLAGLIYAGSAIAAVFSGDLISLFMYWEITAISSVFLIWASRNESSLRCGVRYLVIQVASGVILLAGALLWYHWQSDASNLEHIAKVNTVFADGPSLMFVNFAELGLTTGTTLILIAFGIKAAFPFFHNWLQDAYPKATYSGTVFLSAFTTKLAIYALARGFPGTDILIPIGCLMTVFPIFFAVIENDLRKVLAYSLNNQLGFMVVGIGIGTTTSINGACAHAFAHIIYKGLLFMSMGAVLYRVGTTKASELGGLHRTMPYTTIFCIIGAMSISAFPLMSGFVAKSLITSEAYLGTSIYLSGTAIAFILYFASAGVMEHSGIKIPFFAFFAHDSGKRPKEAPWNMLLAMFIAAVLCIAIGVYPRGLYNLLPYSTDYQPYDVTHVITQFELLLFAALAFGVLLRMGIYPPEKRSVNLDFDWVYRKLIPRIGRSFTTLLSEMWAPAKQSIGSRVSALSNKLVVSVMGDNSKMGQTAHSGAAALWAALLLAAYLILYYG